ncbi:MAG TPA: TIGR02594 family protein [Polyangiaceae bacterium]|nr:TIGR02594 family protein [Polyangiaceae bacterium]
MSTYLVTAASLNLRSAPRLADNIIGLLERGAHVEGLESSPDERWRKVSTGTQSGWAAAKYLAKAEAGPSPITALEEFPWMPIALSELGVKEVPGSGNNARIVEYLQSTDLDRGLASEDATPWCSGFVNWCVEKSGFAGSNSASARSWLHWGKSVAVPRRGCITVFTRDGGGHVAFYVRSEGAQHFVLGGNQSNQVCITGYAKGRLLGFRVPG